MNSIPVEIVCTILRQLENDEKMIARFTCKSWNEICVKDIKIVDAVIESVGKGYSGIAKWAIQMGAQYNAEKCCIESAREGNLESLEYFHALWKNFDGNEISYAAAHYGHIHILKYLKEQKLSWYSNVCGIAAEYGYFDMVKYIIVSGHPAGSAHMTAIANGHSHILIWLLQNAAYIVPKYLYSNATAYGQVEILQWLYDNKYGENKDWEIHSCYMAARLGKIKSLIWLKKHVQNWDKDTYIKLAHHYPSAQKWLMDN
jgi:hypothetical protein